MEYTFTEGAAGSDLVAVPSPYTGAPGGGAPAAPKLDTFVPLNDQALTGVATIDAARAAREAAAARPESTVWAAVKANAALSDTGRIVRQFVSPGFENDVPFDQMAFLNRQTVPLSEAERDYFLKYGTGVHSGPAVWAQLMQERKWREVQGEHGVITAFSAFVDPVQVALNSVTFGAGTAATLGRLGVRSALAQRAGSALVTGAAGTGITAAGTGPVSAEELVLSGIMNTAGGVLVAGPKGGLVAQVDKDLPKVRLDTVLEKPRARWNGEAWEEVPPTLLPDANPTVAAIADDVEAQVQKRTVSQKLGDRLQWNMRKQMAGYGTSGAKVADILLDNVGNPGTVSAEAHREMLRSGFSQFQVPFEAAVRQAMAEDGYGWWKMMNPMTSREAFAAQRNIEKDLALELWRREQSARTGQALRPDTVSPRIAALADKVDEFHRYGLKEMQAAGVEGAEHLKEASGYFHRTWNSAQLEGVYERLKGLGMSAENARLKVRSVVSLSLRRASAFDEETSDAIAGLIIDRASRAGYFEDSALSMNPNARQIIQLRQMMADGGVAEAVQERILKQLSVEADEKGKTALLKRRLDLDYDVSVPLGDGTHLAITDLLDTKITSIMDRYAQQISTTTAFAKVGYKTKGSIEGLREELLHGAPAPDRKAAAELFDNIMAHYRGEPAGQRVNQNFRNLQSFTRAVALQWSGLWQAMEYGNAMGEYGMLKTLKYMAQEMPGFKQLLKPTDQEAGSLANVLSEHSVASLRMRPFLDRFEDGYEMDMGSASQLSLQQFGSSVAVANGMKYVHHHQAKIVGNLIMDRLRMATEGHPKALAALAEYGLDQHVMRRLKAEIDKHGMQVDDWDHKVWSDVRPAFGKMIDATVLRGRLGDVPAFAAFDNVGKFVFTYRSFVLIAHNKLLAGKLSRNDAAGIGLIMMYQMPLAMLAVQAQSVVRGDGTMSEKDMVGRAVGQMGGLGLFSEPWRWASGESNSFGSPGLIAADRAIKGASALMQGNVGTAAQTATTMIPVLATNPIWNRMTEETLKE